MTSNYVDVGGVRLAVHVTGDGPTVLLLHGWPDASGLWSAITPSLVAAGYRVVTVDQRGCGDSDKPASTEDYAMRLLVGDVAAVIDAVGGPVHLVGHDWGSNIAWVAATQLASVASVAALSVGHPTAFRSAGFEQQLKSWYTLLFFHEGVGEAFLRKDDYFALRHWLGHPEVDEVIQRLESTGQLAAQLRWYRANIPPSAFVDPAPVLPPVPVPALGIWSTGDVALSERQMRDSGLYCDKGFRFVRVEGGGHWLPLEKPDLVASHLTSFWDDLGSQAAKR
jgi:pimeloyl-ACP methyl ester carboxylesterase